jgi:hypothetical protein
MLKLKDLLTEKPTSQMGEWELMHNCVFAKNREVWFKDFEREISGRDLMRKIHQAIGEKEYEELSDEDFDEAVLEDTVLGYDTIQGALGLLYYLMIGFCNVREVALNELKLRELGAEVEDKLYEPLEVEDGKSY